MMNERPNEFEPTVWFPPGETLQETLEAAGMSQSELAERTGRTTKHISEVVNGKAPISVETALQFERVLGVPSHLWLGLEQRYRAYLARLEEETDIKQRMEEYRDWMRMFPTNEMVTLNWIRRTDHAVEKVKELLRFFRIASLDQWDEGQIVGYDLRLRSSEFRKINTGSLLAWLWRGKLAGMEANCANYDESSFKKVLRQIRQEVPSFKSELPIHMQALCASAGVALVYVHELPRMRAYGATCWISPNRALIQMCLRGRREDQFWFTFFHEAGHILLHGKTKSFVEEGEENVDKTEEEANKFAADYLIEPKTWQSFAQSSLWDNLNARSYARGKVQIESFARQQKVSPGIVVGRLQREGRIEHRHFNDLKTQLSWLQA